MGLGSYHPLLLLDPFYLLPGRGCREEFSPVPTPGDNWKNTQFIPPAQVFPVRCYATKSIFFFR